jgi:hypothetical protein
MRSGKETVRLHQEVDRGIDVRTIIISVAISALMAGAAMADAVQPKDEEWDKVFLGWTFISARQHEGKSKVTSMCLPETGMCYRTLEATDPRSGGYVAFFETRNSAGKLVKGETCVTFYHRVECEDWNSGINTVTVIP